jgi:hypothetical protein
VSLVHNQLTVGLQLPFDQPVDRSDYISSSLSASGAGSLIGMIRSDGTPACPPVCLSPVDQSSYEWGSGQIRFNVDYTDSSDSMDVSVEIRPPFLPTAWRAWNRDNRNRLLAVTDSQTSAEAGPKMLHFPAHFVIVDFPKQPVLLVATCIYGVALAALLFLICMRPCLANLSSLPPTFWLVQPVMWCQLLFVLGFSSTSFRGFLDSLLPSLARTSFAYFGTRIDFPLLSHIGHKDVANAYYAGKYTTTGDSPYLLETMLLPVLLYFIAWLASLITRGAVKEIAVHVRLAVGCGYGVQFAFMAGLTCVSFFKAGVYIAYTTVGVAIAILLLCLLTFDLLSLRLQYSWRKSFRSLTPSTRGVLVFDTPCTVNQKNDRPTGDVSALGDISTPNTTTLPAEPISIDTIRLPVSEPALYLLMALLLGLLGRAFVVQSILLLILTLVLIAGQSTIPTDEQVSCPRTVLSLPPPRHLAPRLRQSVRVDSREDHRVPELHLPGGLLWCTLPVLGRFCVQVLETDKVGEGGQNYVRGHRCRR